MVFLLCLILQSPPEPKMVIYIVETCKVVEVSSSLENFKTHSIFPLTKKF